jgi:hypothetical protein
VLGDIEDPGQDDRDRQPENGEDDDGLQSPFRGFESIEQDARDLDDDPGDANVEASRISLSILLLSEVRSAVRRV